MTQEELRAELESYDTNEATLKQLVAVRDNVREKQIQLRRSYNEISNYYITGGFCATTDEVRDRLDECLSAIAVELAVYGDLVNRVNREFCKRLDK